MPATRKIQREPRSMDDLMASAERIIHNRVGTMADSSYVAMHFDSPSVSGIPVGPALGGGVASPLNGARLGTTSGRTFNNSDY